MTKRTVAKAVLVIFGGGFLFSIEMAMFQAAGWLGLLFLPMLGGFSWLLAWAAWTLVGPDD